jgi:integrase
MQPEINNMPSVFKRKRRAKDGKVVESRKYTCQYIDATTGKICRVPGFTDKGESWDLARKLEAGTATPEHRKHRKTLLTDHVAAFIRHLQAQNNCEKYVKMVETRIQRMLDGCRFTTLREIALPALEDWLLAQRDGKEFGIKTSNDYGGIFKTFLTWLVDSERAERNPLARFSPLNAETDLKRERRALNDDDFATLVTATLDGPVYRSQINGTDRAMLYVVAAFTGLRVSELASLTPEAFDLESSVVTVQAAHSKRRRLDRQPLRADLVELLRGWLPGHGSGKLWTGSWQHDAAAMLRLDLEAAGIPYIDAAGRVFDFHALRHQFISNLALANVPVKVAQVLARHSTIVLTMDRYSHVEADAAVAGLAKLPALPRLTQESTHGSVPDCPDVAQPDTIHNPKTPAVSNPNVLPQRYLARPVAVCYGSSRSSHDKAKPAAGRLETCSTTGGETVP